MLTNQAVYKPDGRVVNQPLPWHLAWSLECAWPWCCRYIEYENWEVNSATNIPLQVELSPRLGIGISAESDDAGSQRIVLTWKDNVADLDSWTMTPTSRCTVSYNGKICQDDTFKVDLDIDDTSFYGPETTTIRFADRGKFSYFVHIFSAGSWDSIQANVKVYDKAGLVHSVGNPVCSNGGERWWHVVDYEPALRKFTLVNQLKEVRDASYTVHELSASTLGEAPTCECSASTPNAIPDILSGVTDFGGQIVATQGLCREKAQSLFDAANTDVPTDRTASKSVSQLADKVSARIKHRFDAVKAIATKFSALLNSAPTPNAAQRLPCCEVNGGRCNTCNIAAAFSPTIPVDLTRSCLRYPAAVSSEETDGRNGVPDDEMEALIAIQSDLNEALASDETMKWIYVGTSSGGYSIAPKAERPQSTCQTYDPRHRPWYAEAVSGPKSIVILLDTRGGATNLLEASGTMTGIFE
jgi:hypothetical protein